MDARGRGVLGDENTDREIACRGHTQLHGIAQDQSVRRNRHRLATAESEDSIGAWYDARSLRTQREMGGADLDRLLAVSVRQTNPQCVACETGVDNFAECLVGELQFRGSHLLLVG